jgi:hypothetical protein
VRSASEDQLGLVQWDIGVWLNSLCSTLRSLELYLHSVSAHGSSGVKSSRRENYVPHHQAVLIKAIKYSVSEIVSVFGQYLDLAGLEDPTADLSEKVWNAECARS